MCQRSCLFNVPCLPQNGPLKSLDFMMTLMILLELSTTLQKKQKSAILLAHFGRLKGKMETFKVKWPVYSSSAYLTTERKDTQKEQKEKRFLMLLLILRRGYLYLCRQSFTLWKTHSFFFFFKYINK